MMVVWRDGVRGDSRSMWKTKYASKEAKGQAGEADLIPVFNSYIFGYTLLF